MLYQLSYIRKAAYSTGFDANAAPEFLQIRSKICGKALRSLDLFDIADHDVHTTTGDLQRCTVSFDPTLDVLEVGERDRILVRSERTTVDTEHATIRQHSYCIVSEVLADDQSLDLFAIS